VVSAIRLTWGQLYADVLYDCRAAEKVWIYVVQRVGSPDVLAIGSCFTREDAERLARKTMRDIAGEGCTQAAS
jgi:hypothetical protein